MFLIIFHELSEIIKNKYEIKNNEKLKSVFAIPSYWNEKEMNRFRILLDKSEFECLKIIPSYYSSVLAYGYENNNEFDENEKYILLCDIGYINNDYTLVSYRENNFIILNHINGNKNNKFVNGQKIDDLLLKEFENRCKNEGYNINEKGLIKLRKEIIKMKEKLSASGADEIQLTVELDEDKDDFISNFSRYDMNELLKRNRFDEFIYNNVEDLYKVISNNEIRCKIHPVIVGGSSRIPLFKSILCDLIKKDGLLYKSNYNGLIQTLNLDECISEGCCVKYMIDNNYFKVNCELFLEEKVEKKISYSTTLTTSVIDNYLQSMNNLLDTDMENKQLSIYKNEIEASLYHYKRNVNEINEKMKKYSDNIDKDIAWIKDNTVKTMDECKVKYEQIKSEYSKTDKIIV